MPRRTRDLSPSLGELIDRLTIDQIKEIERPQEAPSHEDEMARIAKDLDEVLAQVRPDGELLRLTIALAQVNMHIWRAKETMRQDAGRFEASMKLAHQLNGIRNQLKNRLTARAAGGSAARKTNTGTEDLDGWALSILRP